MEAGGPDWAIVYIGQWFENNKTGAKFFELFFPRYQLCINFLKIGWVTFWATFSQAHLVTLDGRLFVCETKTVRPD
jgi:hypothetical protein